MLVKKFHTSFCLFVQSTDNVALHPLVNHHAKQSESNVYNFPLTMCFQFALENSEVFPLSISHLKIQVWHKIFSLVKVKQAAETVSSYVTASDNATLSKNSLHKKPRAVSASGLTLKSLGLRWQLQSG